MKKALVGMLVVALMIVVAVTATGIFAYFTDSAVSNSTFKAGNLSIDLTDADQSHVETLYNTWDTPVNWAPGQTMGADLTIHNTGNIDVNLVWGALEVGGANPGLSDVILVTELRDSTMAAGANDAPALFDANGKLTLTTMSGWGGNGNDVYWWNGNGGVLIPVGQSVTIHITFKFDPDAGNTYMNNSATMKLTLTAEQVHY